MVPSRMVASPQPLRTGKCMTPKCWKCLKQQDWGRHVKDLGWWFCCIQAVVATKTAWLKSEHFWNRMLQRNSRNEPRFVMIHVNSILPHVQKKLRHIHGKVVQEISPFQSGMSLKTEVVYVSNMSDLMGWVPWWSSVWNCCPLKWYATPVTIGKYISDLKSPPVILRSPLDNPLLKSFPGDTNQSLLRCD